METLAIEEPRQDDDLKTKIEDSKVEVYRHNLGGIGPFVAVYVYPTWLDLSPHIVSATLLGSQTWPLQSYRLKQGVEKIFENQDLSPNPDLIPVTHLDMSSKCAYQYQFPADLENRIIFHLIQ